VLHLTATSETERADQSATLNVGLHKLPGCTRRETFSAVLLWKLRLSLRHARQKCRTTKLTHSRVSAVQKRKEHNEIRRHKN
jgi:hypothetical protein